eukprot:CAMPEP_0180566856 /NCGR_PEP_ID=MMETSP1037_2-20121125/6296_1 /TAXON_ID=632150 /ORGANISM="Azadinium spinosum, Strain 3D9" /LENGTH=117 /DNA_ID=CAMNT_0022583909 /DNA_START=282 /DNA_END=631 /DNA_ORIENTATION=+
MKLRVTSPASRARTSTAKLTFASSAAKPPGCSASRSVVSSDSAPSATSSVRRATALQKSGALATPISFGKHSKERRTTTPRDEGAAIPSASGSTGGLSSTAITMSRTSHVGKALPCR